MSKILFVCGRNRWRSPTAEQQFADRPGIETASAGVNPEAEQVLTAELIGWADLIVVMEKIHRRKVTARWSRELRGKRLICLDIPDNYGLMDPTLIALLEARMQPHLQRLGNSTTTPRSR
jgi:predicted protein tyrosine phosphatase